MVWYFVGVYIINRTLHGRLEIRIFSSRVEKIFHSFAALTRAKYFSTLEEKFRISSQSCNILYILRREQNNLIFSLSSFKKVSVKDRLGTLWPTVSELFALTFHAPL